MCVWRNCTPAAHPTSLPAPLTSRDIVVGLAKADSRVAAELDARQFDSTGMFHWCSPQAMSNCVIVSAFPSMNVSNCYAQFTIIWHCFWPAQFVLILPYLSESFFLSLFSRPTALRSLPFVAHCCHMGTAIKNKPSFVISDIRALCRHSARMSKITNDGLTRSTTGRFIAVPTWQQWASKG